MTATAIPAALQLESTLNELELLGVPWISLQQLNEDQITHLWSVIEKISPEERPAFAAYMSSNLLEVTEATITEFRDHYVGTYTSVHDFVLAYARARWFDPMATADAYTTLTTDLESVLDWVNYDRLTQALFHEKNSPYTFALGMGADHIFTSKTPTRPSPA